MGIEKDIIYNLKRIYKELDHKMSSFKKDCQEGCSYCCNQLVVLTYIEALSIKYYLHNKKVPIAIESEICKSLMLWRDNLGEKFLTSKYDLRTFVSLDRTKTCILCPFLIDNKCFIYEVRPIVCRCYISDDVSQCKLSNLESSPYNLDVIKYEFNAKVENILFGLNTTTTLPHIFIKYYNLNGV